MEKIFYDHPIDILIIGDAHAKPGVSNKRFRWAGKFAVEHRPHVIVDMGDWEDMPSLCAYDYGKKVYEGRRYLEDVKSATEAREEFLAPFKALNRDLAARKQAYYSPLMLALGGNHSEGRISKVLEGDAKLDGILGHRDFKLEEQGWVYVPYRTPIEVAGFTFCHFFTSGVMGRPIAGEMPALQLIRKQLTSCVSGHNHLFDIAHRTKPDGTRVWGIHAGCFLDKDQWEDYAAQANKLWWKGLILLRGVMNGDFKSITTITIEELEDKYGKPSKRSRK